MRRREGKSFYVKSDELMRVVNHYRQQVLKNRHHMTMAQKDTLTKFLLDFAEAFEKAAVSPEQVNLNLLPGTYLPPSDEGSTH